MTHLGFLGLMRYGRSSSNFNKRFYDTEAIVPSMTNVAFTVGPLRFHHRLIACDQNQARKQIKAITRKRWLLLTEELSSSLDS